MSADRQPLSIEVYNSVGGGAFFQRLLREWENAGARVILHQALTESSYRNNRGSLRGLCRRWRMYPGFAWTCWRQARGGPAGSPMRVVTTNPFFAPALVARVARRSGATINLVYDLYPEALIQAGKIAAGSWLARRSAAVTRYALRECAATVFLGEMLRAHAEAAHGPARRAVVIPVGADGEPFRKASPQPQPAQDEPRILYSGQMGLMHDTATVGEALSGGHMTGVTWAFHAGGTGYDRLRKVVGGRPDVTLGSTLPEAEWREAMKRAQVALVTVAPGAERVVMPSKTYSAMVAGQAILAICPKGSDLAALVNRHDCGWVIDPGDVGGLREAVKRIAREPAGLMAKRQNSFAAGHRHYDMRPVAAAWLRLFTELAGDERTPGHHAELLQPKVPLAPSAVSHHERSEAHV